MSFSKIFNLGSGNSKANCPNADKICFLCAEFIPSKSAKPISTKNRELFQSVYGDIEKYGADKFYSPTKFCSAC